MPITTDIRIGAPGSPADLLSRYSASEADVAIERAEALVSQVIYEVFMPALVATHDRLHLDRSETTPFSIGANSKPGRRERRMTWARPHGDVSVVCTVSGPLPSLAVGALEARIVISKPDRGRRYVGGLRQVERLVSLARDLSESMPVEQCERLRTVLEPSFLLDAINTAARAKEIAVADIADMATLLLEHGRENGWVDVAMARVTDDRAPDDEDRWDDSDPDAYHSLSEAFLIDQTPRGDFRIRVLAGATVEIMFDPEGDNPDVRLPPVPTDQATADPRSQKMRLDGARRSILRCLVSVSTHVHEPSAVDGWKVVAAPDDFWDERQWVEACLASPEDNTHRMHPQP